mmetsp:Transcript_14834/g.53361  ORF Transcript_14834/g.53361 Transcript_14834/m.53361 type:complete len:209 (-) Transcript_14834:2116-2742(-)
MHRRDVRALVPDRDPRELRRARAARGRSPRIRGRDLLEVDEERRLRQFPRDARKRRSGVPPRVRRGPEASQAREGARRRRRAIALGRGRDVGLEGDVSRGFRERTRRGHRSTRRAHGHLPRAVEGGSHQKSGGNRREQQGASRRGRAPSREGGGDPEGARRSHRSRESGGGGETPSGSGCESRRGCESESRARTQERETKARRRGEGC